MVDFVVGGGGIRVPLLVIFYVSSLATIMGVIIIFSSYVNSFLKKNSYKKCESSQFYV